MLYYEASSSNNPLHFFPKSTFHHQGLFETQLEYVAKWLSCNGELWGVGPTVLFASAAAVFLINELQASLIIPGDNAGIPVLEKTLLTTMVLGLLALMVHIWVCSMRFFQYYLDTLIKESPSLFLEMTTAGLLGQSELVILGPFTRFLRQQQPQIHITLCWFLSLCYADYVRKNYCQRFNMPYLEQCELPARGRPCSSTCVGSDLISCSSGPRTERRHSTGSLMMHRPSEFWRQLTGNANEMATFAKLKDYVQATRCACVTNFQTEIKPLAPEVMKVERELIIQIVSKDNGTKDSRDAGNDSIISKKGSLEIDPKKSLQVSDKDNESERTHTSDTAAESSKEITGENAAGTEVAKALVNGKDDSVMEKGSIETVKRVADL